VPIFAENQNLNFSMKISDMSFSFSECLEDPSDPSAVTEPDFYAIELIRDNYGYRATDP